jgi:tetratricopeptide (TPR) repeat protein
MRNTPFNIELFISYYESDRGISHYSELVEVLNGLKYSGVQIRTAADILPGEDQDKGYLRLIQQSSVAIFFVSQLWLDSALVRDIIIPRTRDKFRSGKFEILPVPVSPCDLKDLDWLAARPSFPLRGEWMSTRYQDEASRRTLFQAIRDEVLRIARNIQNKSTQRRSQDFISLYRQGLQLINIGQARYAREKFEAALRLKSGEQTIAAGLVHIEVGHCQRKMGAQYLAFQNYLAALKIAEKIKNRGLKSHAHDCLGNIFREQGILSRAVEQYELSKKLLPKDDYRIYLIDINLGATLRRIGKFNEARILFESSISGLEKEIRSSTSAKKKSKLRRSIGISLGMLSLNCVSLKEYDEAIRLAKRGLALAFKYDNPRGIGFAKFRVAQTFLAGSYLNEAYPLLKEALTIAFETEDVRQVFAVLLELGRYYFLSNRAEDAERYFFSAMMDGVTTSDLFRIAQSHQYVALIRGKNAKAALYYLEIARRLYGLVGANYWEKNILNRIKIVRNNINRRASIIVIMRACGYIEEALNKHVSTRCHFTDDEIRKATKI